MNNAKGSTILSITYEHCIYEKSYVGPITCQMQFHCTQIDWIYHIQSTYRKLKEPAITIQLYVSIWEDRGTRKCRHTQERVPACREAEGCKKQGRNSEQWQKITRGDRKERKTRDHPIWYHCPFRKAKRPKMHRDQRNTL